MARGRKRASRSATGALGIVQQARHAAKAALDKLRDEIASTRALLERLLEEERIFRADVLGGDRAPKKTRVTTKTKAKTGTRRRRRAPKRPPRAAKYYEKLPQTFTLEDVRKLAGRGAGISLAQWSRAKRIKKVGDKYQKVA